MKARRCAGLGGSAHRAFCGWSAWRLAGEVLRAASGALRPDRQASGDDEPKEWRHEKSKAAGPNGPRAVGVRGVRRLGAYAVEKEEENNPRILVLEGKASELKGTLKGNGAEFIQLNGEKTLKAETASLLLENCEIITGNEKDTNLCKDVPLHFTGVKQELVACRSENAKGEKDPVETVLELLDLHMAAGGSPLGPLLLMRVLGTALEEEVILNCGGVKIQLKGVKEGEKNKAGAVVCTLSPGLVNIPTTTNIAVLCKVNATTHDEEPPSCSILCFDFGTLGLEADPDGKTFKDVAWAMHLEGTLNKDIFIDD